MSQKSSIKQSPQCVPWALTSDIADIAAELEDFIDGDPVVTFFPVFDLRFWEEAFSKINQGTLFWVRLIDLSSIIRLFEPAGYRSFDKACIRHGVYLSQRKNFNVTVDCYAIAELYCHYRQYRPPIEEEVHQA